MSPLNCAKCGSKIQCEDCHKDHYHYFVSFSHSGGLGNINFHLFFKITPKNIVNLQKELELKEPSLNISNSCVINFIELDCDCGENACEENNG